MQYKYRLIAKIYIFAFLFSGLFLLSGCGGGGGGGGSPAGSSASAGGAGGYAASARFSADGVKAGIRSSAGSISWPDTGVISISGTVTAGGSPLSGVTVYLYETGVSAAPLSSAVTDSNGRYSGLSYAYSDGSGSSAPSSFYVAADTLPAGSSAAPYTLMNLYVGNSVVNINEFTTAEVGYALNGAGGSIAGRIINAGSINSFDADYDSLTDGSVNNYELYYIADSLAYCIRNENLSGSCYMSSAFSGSGLYYLKGSGEFTLLAARYYTDSSIQTAAYNSYSYYANNGTRAPFRIPSNAAAAGQPVNVMNVYFASYSDANMANDPYVNVYVNGSPTPIPLLLDTGATGIMINQSALTAAGVYIPSTNYGFSGNFGDGGTFSGYVAYANVASSSGLTAQSVPVAVALTDTDMPSNGFFQGDFGMGMSPYYSFGGASSGSGSLFTPSFAAALSSGYNNGFILNFSGINFGYGYNNTTGGSTPAGTLTYGLNTAADNAVPAGSIFYPDQSINSGYYSAYPYIQSEYGGQLYNPAGYEFYSFLDTGSTYIYMGNNALDYSIAGFSTADVDANCFDFVLGGLLVNLSFYNSGGSYISNGFITDPNAANGYNSFCDYDTFYPAAGNAVILDDAISYGNGQGNGQEDLGLPFMFDRIVYWQAKSSNASWGIGIEP